MSLFATNVVALLQILFSRHPLFLFARYVGALLQILFSTPPVSLFATHAVALLQILFYTPQSLCLPHTLLLCYRYYFILPQSLCHKRCCSVTDTVLYPPIVLVCQIHCCPGSLLPTCAALKRRYWQGPVSPNTLTLIYSFTLHLSPFT